MVGLLDEVGNKGVRNVMLFLFLMDLFSELNFHFRYLLNARRVAN